MKVNRQLLGYIYYKVRQRRQDRSKSPEGEGNKLISDQREPPAGDGGKIEGSRQRRR